MTQQTENWVKVPGFEAYEISDHGNVRRGLDRQLHPGKPLTAIETRNGYLSVRLSKDTKGYTKYIHRLVVQAFIGPLPSGKHQAAHWDGNKKNNHVSNLRWATSKENAADNVRLGRMACGADNHMTVLTPEKVLAIRASHKKKSDIAREFGIAPNTVAQILRGETWKHV